MRRGEIYRLHHPSDDPKLYRRFAVVSCQTLIDSRFPAVVCAPLLTRNYGCDRYHDLLLQTEFAVVRKSLKELEARTASLNAQLQVITTRRKHAEESS